MKIWKPIRGTLVNKSHPLARNLVAAYPLNEGSGKIIHNCASPSYRPSYIDPRCFPDLTLTAEKWEGSGLLFETGNTDYAYADISDISSYPLSIFAKVRFETVTAVTDMTVATIADKSELLNKGSALVIDYNSPNHKFSAYSAFGAVASGPNFTMSVGDVYTALAVFAANNDRRIYVNGGNLNTDSASVGSATIDRVSIGMGWNISTADYELEGTFVECVYFWDRVLSGDEAAWLHREPYAMFGPPQSHRRIYQIPQYGYSFGEQNPNYGIKPEVWGTFDKSDETDIDVSGDSEWGKGQVEEDDYILSPVKMMPVDVDKEVSIIRDKYGSSTGPVYIYYRTSDSPFDMHDATPNWTLYAGQFVTGHKYIQLKVERDAT